MNMKDYTNTSKKNIISALRDKGVDVNDDVEWYELDDKIEQIENATGAHSDWNQNDNTAAGYIKNRPFYTLWKLYLLKRVLYRLPIVIMVFM